MSFYVNGSSTPVLTGRNIANGASGRFVGRLMYNHTSAGMIEGDWRMRYQYISHYGRN